MRFLRSGIGIGGGLGPISGLDTTNEGFTVVPPPGVIEGAKNLRDSLDETEFKLASILNNGITFGDNVRGGFIEVTLAGGEQEVRHDLGFEPVGFLLIWKDGLGDVYADRVTEWDKETLFLNTDATNLKVRLFVL